MSRLFLGLVLLFFFQLNPLVLQAAETQSPPVAVHPSHIFNTETAWTLGQNQLLVYSYSGNTRLAFGATPWLEPRLDVNALTLIQKGANNTTYRAAGTLKAHLLGSESQVGLGAQAYIENGKTFLGDSTWTFIGKLPLSVIVGRTVVTLDSRFSQNLSVTSQQTAATDIGILAPAFPFLSLVVEGGVAFPKNDHAYIESTAGVIFVLTPTISVPLVALAKDAQGTAAGIVAVVASIGFQL